MGSEHSAGIKKFFIFFLPNTYNCMEGDNHMARPLRNTTRGITQHVFSRCIERKNMLGDTFASELLLTVIQMTQDKYRFELIAYQIMDNHFHFVIRTLPEEASISKIMQYIKARFAEQYNRYTKRTGPFWNERFRDIIIDEAPAPAHYLLWLLWYLAFNPIRKSTGVDPRTYRYSSINCYLDEQHTSPVKIIHHQFFIKLGSTFLDRVKAFLWYEEAYRKRWAIYF